MGRDLGRLGTVRAERTDTFEYFDESKVRVHPNLTDLLLVDFMLKAGEVDEQDVPAAMAALHGLFLSLVHPDDFGRFWEAALANRQQVRDLMKTVYDLIEGLSERPTKRRPASSAGRRSAGPKSRRVSSDPFSRVIAKFEKAGRTDLALHVVQARDAQRAG